MPWDIKEEMQHFIRTTKGHTVVMGRKTFQSIGKPLPKRTNIVLTNNTELKIEGVTICNDFNWVINQSKKEDIFIIGGASIYKLFFPYANQLIISHLPKSYKCTEFLKFDLSKFTLVNTVNYDKFFVTIYDRK